MITHMLHNLTKGDIEQRVSQCKDLFDYRKLTMHVTDDYALPLLRGWPSHPKAPAIPLP
jgi:hypothetical protein